MKRHVDLLAIALAGALLGFLYLLASGIDSSVTVDDAVYALPALQLADGRWDVEYPFVDVDPDGDAFAYRGTRTDEGFFLAAKNPAWHLAGGLGHRVAGVAGHRAVVLAGMAGAVVATGALARQLGSRRAGLIAATLALTTPLVAQSMSLWAHVVAAAAIGSGMIAALRLANDRTSPVVGTAWLMASVGLAASVRTDGAVFGLGVCAVLVIEAVWRRRWSVSVSGMVGVATAAVTHLVSAQLITTITGGAAEGRGTQLRGQAGLGGRVEGFVQTFLSSSYDRASYAMAGVVLIASVVAGYLMVKGRTCGAATALGVVAAATVLKTVLWPRDPFDGLAAAWPLLVVGLALLAVRSSPDERRLVGMMAIGSLGIIATQYDIGGAWNWGGRFVTATIPALVALVAVRVDAMIDEPKHKPVLVVVAVVAICSLVSSIVWDTRIRGRHDDLTSVAEGVGSEIPIVASTVLPMPALAWRMYPDHDWLVVPDDEAGGVDRLREILKDAGVDRVALFAVDDDDYSDLTGDDAAGNTPDRPVIVELP